MRATITAIAFTLTGFFAGAAFFIAASLVLALIGPTSAPPNGNVSAPINVGTTSQIKNAGLGVNSLAVFGNAILAGASSYLNFGPTAGSSGYGIRDNAGTIEFKNNAGSWSNLSNSVLNVLGSGAVTQIKFSDGTTQTTADKGIAASTVATCDAGAGACTVSCPATYFRTGCSVNNINAQAVPSGTNACACSSAGVRGLCYAICAK